MSELTPTKLIQTQTNLPQIDVVHRGWMKVEFDRGATVKYYSSNIIINEERLKIVLELNLESYADLNNYAVEINKYRNKYGQLIVDTNEKGNLICVRESYLRIGNLHIQFAGNSFKIYTSDGNITYTIISYYNIEVINLILDRVLEIIQHVKTHK